MNRLGSRWWNTLGSTTQLSPAPAPAPRRHREASWCGPTAHRVIGTPLVLCESCPPRPHVTSMYALVAVYTEAGVVAVGFHTVVAVADPTSRLI